MTMTAKKNQVTKSQGTMSCPTCGVDFTTAENRTLPFCSMRCKQIDLGRWFNEDIGLPVEPDALEDEWDA